MMAFLDDHPDKVLMASSTILMMLGIIFIYSASGPFCQFQNHPTWYFLMRQSAWAAVALIALLVAYRLDYEIIIKISPYLMMFSLLALIVVFPLSSAKIKRWINIGGFTFQPSELFKLAMVAFMARIAGKNIGKEEGYKKLFPTLLIVLFGTFLIVREPDLGTSSLVLGIAVALLYLAGFPKRYLLVVGLIGVIFASIFVFVIGYEKNRVYEYTATLENPFDSKASYQTRQSLVSLGSGGFMGKGLANGGQKHLFLPARHTDFILASSAEEGGFLIVAVILALFGLIGWSGYKIAVNAVDLEGTLLAWGVMLALIMQATINIGVAIGLFPITGMTLPFMSYGGSSLLICNFCIGMLGSVARRSRSPRYYFKRFKS